MLLGLLGELLGLFESIRIVREVIGGLLEVFRAVRGVIRIVKHY